MALENLVNGNDGHGMDSVFRPQQTRSFIHLFIHSFIHSFHHSVIHSILRQRLGGLRCEELHLLLLFPLKTYNSMGFIEWNS